MEWSESDLVTKMVDRDLWDYLDVGRNYWLRFERNKPATDWWFTNLLLRLGLIDTGYCLFAKVDDVQVEWSEDDVAEEDLGGDVEDSLESGVDYVVKLERTERKGLARFFYTGYKLFAKRVGE